MGCIHFQHKWMAQHRGFHDEFYHDEHLIEQYNKVVGKKDLTFLLGDITMEKSEPYYLLDRLNGRKIVVQGNHDRYQDTRELLKYVETTAGMIDYKGFCLTHAPIHPSEIGMYMGNIHAHIHENKLVEVLSMDKYLDHDSVLKPTLNKYHNVDACLINYKPKTLEEILNTK